MSGIPFVAFPSIPRLRRAIVITEKIDGTNAQVHVTEDGHVFAGSRSRWITPEDDNFGFAKWVAEHEEELRVGLGPGTHYGEWWGSGIQRKYNTGERRFSLFNSARWTDERRPACCHVVPVLFQGTHSDSAIEDALARLRTEGSVAAPGFMRPEGIVVYHSVSGSLFKVLLENDELPKSVAERQVKP